ncbi:MAG: alpha/beta hydrolase [Gemmatimonadaceae bacterium]
MIKPPARRWLVALVALPVGLGAAAAALYLIKNPERESLQAAARTDVPGRLVALDAGVTHYRSAGPDGGRVAVLVHGFSVPSYIWDSTLVALGDAGYRVIAYDLFGRGWSDRPDATYDGAFYDAQLAGLLDSLRVRGPVDLFGLSFGGYVTAHFVSTHPARVRTLTLVDPTTRGRTVPTILRVPIVGHYLFQVSAVPTMADNQASDFLHPDDFPDWAERYRPQMRYRGFGRSLRRSLIATAAADFPAYYDAIARAGIPVLLIWGTEDRVLPIERAADITSRIARTEFFPVDSAGHLPHLEQSARVHARILAFLAANP